MSEGDVLILAIDLHERTCAADMAKPLHARLCVADVNMSAMVTLYPKHEVAVGHNCHVELHINSSAEM